MRIHGLHLLTAATLLAIAAPTASAQDEGGRVEHMALSDLHGEFNEGLQIKRWEKFRAAGMVFLCKIMSNRLINSLGTLSICIILDLDIIKKIMLNETASR